MTQGNACIEPQSLLPFEKKGDFERSVVERCARVCERHASEKEERWQDFEGRGNDKLAQLRYCEMETAKLLARRIRRYLGHV